MGQASFPGRGTAAPPLLSLLLSLLLPWTAAAQQSSALAGAIEDYWNGRYEQALERLSETALGELPAGEHSEGLKYRAFALVALDRTGEAQAAFDRLLERDPGHRLDQTLVSPKILARFGAARGARSARLFEAARGHYDAGDYAAAREGFDALLALDSGHEMGREFRQLCLERLQLAEVAASRPPEPAPEPEPVAVDVERVYTVTSDMVAPALERRVDPEYPRTDRVRGLGGTVVLVVVVESDGSVGETRVLRSVNASLDAAASRAVKRWRYRPALLGLVPVAAYQVVTLQFVP